MSGESSKSQDGSWIVSLLADKWIQRWKIHGNGAEAYLFEDHEIFNKIFNIFHKKLWSNRGMSVIFSFINSFTIIVN